MGCGQKKLLDSVAVPPAAVRVANDKGDNEMTLGAVHRCFGISLTAEENPQKTSARRPSDEGAMRSVIASNGVLFLQMRPVGPHSTSGREKEIKFR